MMFEYVWLDAAKGFRSKIRVIPISFQIDKHCPVLSDVPRWNYDGSSTGQSTTSESEVTLVPQFLCRNPTMHAPAEPTYIVLCDTYKADGAPTCSNARRAAAEVFEQMKVRESDPWFGFEQEYFLGLSPLAADQLDQVALVPAGESYCGVGHGNVFGRRIAEAHLQYCLRAGLQISGINAEVAPGQWEFQIGPVSGIEAADQLLVGRYLLQKVAEDHGTSVIWHPKPWAGQNGSGCHTNYSTKSTREGKSDQNGLAVILEHGDLLKEKHTEHMEAYGENNDLRMTGTNETARFDTFSIGVGNRSASVRIGNDTARAGQGYYEDRRPASNCDPYMVSSKLVETTVLCEDGVM